MCFASDLGRPSFEEALRRAREHLRPELAAHPDPEAFFRRLEAEHSKGLGDPMEFIDGLTKAAAERCQQWCWCRLIEPPGTTRRR
jgi:hypothetical protein